MPLCEDILEFIRLELRAVENKSDPSVRFSIYRNAFDLFNEETTNYQTVLSLIKFEYDNLIDSIQQQQDCAKSSEDEIRSLAALPSTIHNYQLRINELNSKIQELKQSNSVLFHKVRMLRKERKERETLLTEVERPKRQVIPNDFRHIPGLTEDENFDISALTTELTRLENQIKSMEQMFQSKCVPKSEKEEVLKKLNKKESEMLLMEQRIENLTKKKVRLDIAVAAAKEFNDVRPANLSLKEVVMNSLKACTRERHEGKEAREVEEPSLGSGLSVRNLIGLPEINDVRSENILQYMDRFHELIDSGQYESAALHAANSPNGLIRNMQTILTFKRLKPTTQGRSPLLALFDAMLSLNLPGANNSPSASIQKLDIQMSSECVKCAIAEERMDLLSHWISLNKLSLDKSVGDLIYNYAQKSNNTLAHSTAEKVYRTCEAHDCVVRCLLNTGKLHSALRYASHANFTEQNYSDMLSEFPKMDVVKALTGVGALPLPSCIHSLFDAEHTELALELLDNAIHESTNGSNYGLFSEFREQWMSVVALLNEYGNTATADTLLSKLRST